eukprot:93995-Pleurochrysis_carterae.AAC.1
MGRGAHSADARTGKRACGHTRERGHSGADGRERGCAHTRIGDRFTHAPERVHGHAPVERASTHARTVREAVGTQQMPRTRNRRAASQASRARAAVPCTHAHARTGRVHTMRATTR